MEEPRAGAASLAQPRRPLAGHPLRRAHVLEAAGICRGYHLHARARHYRQALAAAGIAPDPALERTELFDSDHAEAAAHELLIGPDRPTALFTGQNLITIGAIRALRALGIQRRVALAGFDDVVLGDLVEPGITVIAQDPYELGRRAGELLFARLGGLEAAERLEIVPTRLIARGSGEIPVL
jgi:LacI family transcriptional regulator